MIYEIKSVFADWFDMMKNVVEKFVTYWRIDGYVSRTFFTDKVFIFCRCFPECLLQTKYDIQLTVIGNAVEIGMWVL